MVDDGLLTDRYGASGRGTRDGISGRHQRRLRGRRVSAMKSEGNRKGVSAFRQAKGNQAGSRWSKDGTIGGLSDGTRYGVTEGTTDGISEGNEGSIGGANWTEVSYLQTGWRETRMTMAASRDPHNPRGIPNSGPPRQPSSRHSRCPLNWVPFPSVKIIGTDFSRHTSQPTRKHSGEIVPRETNRSCACQTRLSTMLEIVWTFQPTSQGDYPNTWLPACTLLSGFE
jgi:hypothetical protein